MIVAEGLNKRYGPTVAVDDLTFRVKPGEVTGFLGPNGAGKSTTMRLILGLDAPTGGSVTVNGRAMPRPGSRCTRSARSLDAARRRQPLRVRPSVLVGPEQSHQATAG